MVSCNISVFPTIPLILVGLILLLLGLAWICSWGWKSTHQQLPTVNTKTPMPEVKQPKIWNYPKGHCQKCGSTDINGGGSWTPESCNKCNEMFFDHEGY